MFKQICSFGFLVFISTLLCAQLHRNNDRYCSDTVFYDNQKTDVYYIATLAVSLDSVVSLDGNDKEYYTYRIEVNHHDPNLKIVDTIVACTYEKIMFQVKESSLYFYKDASDSDVHADFKTQRIDSSTFVLHSAYSYFGFNNSKMTIKYFPKDYLFSSFEINNDQSLFFRRLRYEYGVGITLIELQQVCVFGRVTFYKQMN